MSTRRRVVLGAALIFLISISIFVGYRFWQHTREEPLEEGVFAWKSGDYALALRRLEPFAEQGNPLAQRILGDIYARGLGLAVDDRLATMWFRREECRCLLTGENEYNLALDLSSPGSTTDDRAGAVVWLQRAAEAGHPDAQRLLSDPTALSSRGLTVDSSVVEYWDRRRR